MRCVIFDMDGTLADTLPLCIAAFRRSVEELSGERLTDRAIVETFGPSEEGTIAALLPDRFREGMERYLSHYRALHPVLCPRPFYGIPRLFYQLRRGGTGIALVTGKGARSLEITLRYLDMADWFDHIETGSHAGPCKPEGIARTLDRLDLRPEEAVYVGDAPSDITAARAVSVPVIAAAWAGTADPEALAANHPDLLCRSVRDLSRHLQAVRQL